MRIRGSFFNFTNKILIYIKQKGKHYLIFAIKTKILRFVKDKDMLSKVNIYTNKGVFELVLS